MPPKANSIRRQVDALDEAVAMFRKSGKEAWANDIADVRDFIARSKAYYDRQTDRRNQQGAKRTQNARDLAQVMWSEITRKGK